MNKKEKKPKDFILTKVTWHEVSSKIDIEPLQKILNQKIQLSKYGKGVKRLLFTFVAVPPHNDKHPNHVNFNKKKQELEVTLSLSYSHILTVSPENSIQMMAALFLVAIDLYKNLKIQDFDLKLFKKDIEQLFIEHKWIEKVEKEAMT